MLSSTYAPRASIRTASAARGRELRVAQFSGNYDCVRDGANQALNRLVEHLLSEGAAVRIYSPVAAEPAFKMRYTFSACPRCSHRCIGLCGAGENPLCMRQSVCCALLRYVNWRAFQKAMEVLGGRPVVYWPHG